MNVLLVVSVLYVCVKYVDSVTCSIDQPAEGFPIILDIKTRSQTGKIQVKLRNIDGDDVTVSDCDINRNPRCEIMMSTDDFKGGMMLKNSATHEYSVILKIQNVTRIRDQATLSWASGDFVIGHCDLPIYSFQTDPVCETLGISNNGTTVSWTCRVNNVYPEMDCQFEYRKGSVEEYELISQNFESENTTDEGLYPPRTTYHDYTCILDLPISKIQGAGIHQFQFSAVVVSGSKHLKTKTWGYEEISFVTPQAVLVNCPSYYIKYGDNTKTCECQLQEAGNPPGVAQWLDTHGNIIGDDIDKEATFLSLVFNPDEKSPTYTCRGNSALKGGSTMTYSPLFAYGPTMMTVSLHDNSDIVTTFESDPSFTMYCDIPVTSVSPKPIVNVTASDDSDIRPQSDYQTEGVYRYPFIISPKNEGLLVLSCLAYNTEFSDMTTNESKIITVQKNEDNDHDSSEISSTTVIGICVGVLAVGVVTGVLVVLVWKKVQTRGHRQKTTENKEVRRQKSLGQHRNPSPQMETRFDDYAVLEVKDVEKSCKQQANTTGGYLNHVGDSGVISGQTCFEDDAHIYHDPDQMNDKSEGPEKSMFNENDGYLCPSDLFTSQDASTHSTMNKIDYSYANANFHEK